jgi:hypothetical protein
LKTNGPLELIEMIDIFNIWAQIIGILVDIWQQNPKKTPINKPIFKLFLYLCRRINRMPITGCLKKIKDAVFNKREKSSVFY